MALNVLTLGAGYDTLGWRLAPEFSGVRFFEVDRPANEAWDDTAQTVITAEGLVMYLPPEAARDLFVQCAAINGRGSRMAFTYIGTGADGRPDVGRWTGLVLWLLKVSGEPWLWSVRPEGLGRFLEATGWTSAPESVGTADKHGVEFFGVAMR